MINMENQEKYRHCLESECDYCTESTFTLGSCTYRSKALGLPNGNLSITLREPCYWKLNPLAQSNPKCTEDEKYHTCPGDTPFDPDSAQLFKTLCDSALEDAGVYNFF